MENAGPRNTGAPSENTADVTLRESVADKLYSMDVRFNEQMDALTTLLQEKDKSAVEKAEATIKEWRATQEVWRDHTRDIMQNVVTHPELAANITSVEGDWKLACMQITANTKRSKYAVWLATVNAVVTVIVLIVLLALRYIRWQ
jgi:hypothetical protein